MKYILGKSDWTDAARGEEHCYLLTNGLGGYCLQSVIGSNTMGDHGLLIAADVAPARRYTMLVRVDECLYVNGRAYELSSQTYAGQTKNSEGFRYLDTFSLDGLPTWQYCAEGVRVVKRLALQYGHNNIAIEYEIDAPRGVSAYLEVTPVYGFHGKNDRPKEAADIRLSEYRAESCPAGADSLCLSADEHTLYLETDGTSVSQKKQICRYYYEHDDRNGREAYGNGIKLHKIKSSEAQSGSVSLSLIYTTDESLLCRLPAGAKDILTAAEKLFENEKARLNEIQSSSGFKSEAARQLAVSAKAFLTRRESTGKMSIVAGFPFFADWGRDTMIALTGCTLSSGDRDAARSILETFIRYCRRGIMPNLFPEGENEPMYNTVDASLYFVNALWEYFCRYGDEEFALSALPTAESIISFYANGTDYDIRMDSDYLISAGSGKMQLTWMDVCCEGVLPTPRHGKPVEVNAAWYSAVCVLQKLYEHFKESRVPAPLPGTPKLLDGWNELNAGQRAIRLTEFAEHIRENFLEKFTKPDGTLYDVLTEKPSAAMTQVRCNEVFALAMPFSMIEGAQAQCILSQIRQELYTPLGLRSLSVRDREFHGFYGGTQFERDMAYHQGTVWVYPLGAYYRARLRYAKDKRAEAKITWLELEAVEAALHEGCLGQLAEIYDGKNPTVSRGCCAQAWSTAEILRVYEELEKPEYT